MKVSVIAVTAAVCVFGAVLQPADVKIVGSLEYGQTSDPVEYTGTPKYAAFVFNGNGGDQIEVSVRGGTRSASISIADGGLKELTTGTSHITFTLPKTGPDLETYYIVLHDSEYQAGRFTVQLLKPQQKAA